MLSLIKCVAFYTKWDENKQLLKPVSKFLALNLKVVGVSPSFIRFLSFRYHMKALVISGNQSFISQLLNIVGPLGEKFDFFNPLGFEIQSAFDHKISKIKFCSGRAFI